MDVPTHLKFQLWYLDIFKFLEHDTNKGSGAIIALMGAMPLYERWICANSTTRESKFNLIANDLKIGDIDRAKKFWNVVRDGLCHTGSFFEESSSQKKEGWVDLPRIGLSKDYPDTPTFITDPNTQMEVIIFNPWSLVSHILQKFEGNLYLLEGPDAPLLPLSYTIDYKP